MHQKGVFGQGSAPDLASRAYKLQAYSALQTPSWIKGLLLRERGVKPACKGMEGVKICSV